ITVHANNVVCACSFECCSDGQTVAMVELLGPRNSTTETSLLCLMHQFPRMLWRGDLSGVLFVARLPFVGGVILQPCGPLRRGGLLSTCHCDRRLGCNGTVVC